MEDDTLYFPKTDFEWEMKEEMGFPYFRKYKQQVEEEKQRERELIKNYELD